MDPASAVAAALGFVGQGIAAAKTVNDLIDRYKSAPDQLDEITESIQSTIAALQLVSDILNDEQHADFPAELRKTPEWYSLVNKQLTRCNTLLLEIEKTLRSLVKDDGLSTGAKLRWSIYRKDAVLDILGRLRDVKIELNQSVTASSLQREVKQLRINNYISKAEQKNKREIEELERSLREDRITSLKKQLMLEELEKQKNLRILKTRQKMNLDQPKPANSDKFMQRPISTIKNDSSATVSNPERQSSAQDSVDMYAASTDDINKSAVVDEARRPANAIGEDHVHMKIGEDGPEEQALRGSPSSRSEGTALFNSKINGIPPFMPATVAGSLSVSSEQKRATTDLAENLFGDAPVKKAADGEPQLDDQAFSVGKKVKNARTAEQRVGVQFASGALPNERNEEFAATKQPAGVERRADKAFEEPRQTEIRHPKLHDGNKPEPADRTHVQNEDGSNTGQFKTVRWRKRLHRIKKKVKQYSYSPHEAEGLSSQKSATRKNSEKDKSESLDSSHDVGSASKESIRPEQQDGAETHQEKRNSGQRNQLAANGKVEDWLTETLPSTNSTHRSFSPRASKDMGNIQTADVTRHLPGPSTGEQPRPGGLPPTENEALNRGQWRAGQKKPKEKKPQQRPSQPSPPQSLDQRQSRRFMDTERIRYQSNPVAQAQGVIVDLNLPRSTPQSQPRSFSFLEGWMLRPTQPAPGAPGLSWSRCVHNRLPMTFEELSLIVRQYLASGRRFWDDLLALSWYQRQQVSHLIDEKNASESDPSFEWFVAAIITEPSGVAKFHILTIHIILQRRPRIGGTTFAPSSLASNVVNENYTEAPTRDSARHVPTDFQQEVPANVPSQPSHDVNVNVAQPGIPQYQWPASNLNSKPIWTRMHQRDVDPETLDHLGLPWDWDFTHHGYLIIKRYLSHEDQRDIFEHTRRLRQLKEEQDHLNTGSSIGEISKSRKHPDNNQDVRLERNKNKMYMVRSKQLSSTAPKSARRSQAQRTSDSIEEIDRTNFSDQPSRPAPPAKWLAKLLFQPIFTTDGGSRIGKASRDASSRPNRPAGFTNVAKIEEIDEQGLSRPVPEEFVFAETGIESEEEGFYHPRRHFGHLQSPRVFRQDERERKDREPPVDERLQINPLVGNLMKQPLPSPDPLLAKVLSKWGGPDEDGLDALSIETKSDKDLGEESRHRGEPKITKHTERDNDDLVAANA